MGYLSVLVLRSGQRLRCASGCRDTEQPRAKGGCKNNGVIGTPTCATVGGRAAKSQGRPTAKRNLPQLTLSKESKPLSVRGKERGFGPVGTRDRSRIKAVHRTKVELVGAALTDDIREVSTIGRDDNRSTEIHTCEWVSLLEG